MIDTTHNNVYLLNQINGNITRSGVVYQKKINPHDLCYQFSKDVPDFYFANWGLGIIEMNVFTAEIILLSCQIKNNTLFKNNDWIKIRK